MDLKTLYSKMKEITEEAFENYVEEIVEERVLEVGIERTVSSLLEAGVDFDNCIRVLMKYWNISLKDAWEYTRVDMVEIHPYRKFLEYYVKEGYSEDRVHAYWTKVGVKMILKMSPELAKLPPAELYKEISKQTDVVL